MTDNEKNRKELIEEVQQLRMRIAVLEDMGEDKTSIEHRLADEHKLLLALINNVPDYIYAKDLRGRFIIANQATASLLGVKNAGKLISKTDFDFVSEELASKYDNDEKQVIRTGKPLVRADEAVTDVIGDGIRYMSTIKSPLYDSDDNVIGTTGMSYDVTARKLSEEKIIAINQQLEAGNQQLKAANQQLSASYQQLESANQQLEANHQELDAAHQQLQASHQQLQATNQQLCASEAALANSEAIYRKTVENAHGVPYHIRFSDYQFEFVGSGCEELFGFPSETITPADIMGLHYKKRIVTSPNPSRNLLAWYKAMETRDEELAEAWHVAYHDEISRGETPDHITLDFRIRLANGQVKWFSDNVLFLRDAGTGKVNGSLGIYQDITERKLAEEKIAAINQQLESANQQLEANHQELDAAHQQLQASHQQLESANQQLCTSESTLTRSQAIYQQAISNANCVPYQIRFPDNQYDFVGSRFKEVFDVSGEELTLLDIKKSIEERIVTSPNPSENLLAMLKARTDGNKELALSKQAEYHEEIFRGKASDRVTMDYRIKLPDGRGKWFSDYISYIKDEKSGKVTGALGILQDITDRKMAEEKTRSINQLLESANQQLQGSQAALERSKDIYQKTIENANGCVYEIRFPEREYVFVGPGFEKLFGIKKGEFTIGDLKTMVEEEIVTSPNPPENLAAYFKERSQGCEGLAEDKYTAYHKDISDGKAPDRLITDYRLHLPDGRIKWISDSVLYLRDSKSGEVTGSLGIIQDITERKLAEHQLQKAHDELENRVAERTSELTVANEELLSEVAERKKAEKRLVEHQKQLRSLTSKLSTAEEYLRRQIAMDVHDQISQNLAISKIKLDEFREAVMNSQNRKLLDGVRDLLAKAIKNTRSITFELSPPVLHELGFESAIDWLVRDTEKKHGCLGRYIDDGNDKGLDNDLSIMLFRAVQELLVNVAKHARAKNVKVSTRCVNGEVHVVVEDDGVGFNLPDDMSSMGFGLFNIRERLNYIGGRMDIKAVPEKGSVITLIVPLSKDSEKEMEQSK
ncbi:PAS domain S-box protein [Planctomycetota bacterium]